MRTREADDRRMVRLGVSVFQPVDPLSKAESATDYYTYNNPFASSGDPDFGTQSSVGFFWLYENSL